MSNIHIIYWPLILTTQLSTSNLSDNPDSSHYIYMHTVVFHSNSWYIMLPATCNIKTIDQGLHVHVNVNRGCL